MFNSYSTYYQVVGKMKKTVAFLVCVLLVAIVGSSIVSAQALFTCGTYCIQLGYSTGTCRQTKHDCFANGEDWQNGGNMYCNEGPVGGGAGNYCCYPGQTSTTTIPVTTTTIPDIPVPEFPSAVIPFAALFATMGIVVFLTKK